MRPSEAASGPLIAPLVAHNFALLSTLVDVVTEPEEATSAANSHLARLRLWAGTLGAHRSSGGRSLEYRLRDASSMKRHVISLLGDLRAAAERAHDVAKGTADAEPDSADDELEQYFQEDDELEKSEIELALAEIGHTLDCLLRLSATISNPAPHDQFRSRAGTKMTEYFEPWDIKHVQEKFAGVDLAIANRLGKAMSQRRQYFKYREEHHHKLASGLDENENEADKTTIASSIPEHMKDKLDAVASRNDDNRSEFSMTSYALSSANPDQLRVPPIPKEYVDGPFLCPLCHMIIEIDTRHGWKKHVFRDLRPYICLETSCPVPNLQYLRRSDWSRHMRMEHWSTWSCSLGCPGAFQTPADLRDHNKGNHQKIALMESLTELEASSAQLDSAKVAKQCPLCRDFEITTLKQYESHVGRHLELLALFALPKALESEEPAGKDDGQDDSHSVHGPIVASNASTSTTELSERADSTKNALDNFRLRMFKSMDRQRSKQQEESERLNKMERLAHEIELERAQKPGDTGYTPNPEYTRRSRFTSELDLERALEESQTVEAEKKERQLRPEKERYDAPHQDHATVFQRQVVDPLRHELERLEPPTMGRVEPEAPFPASGSDRERSHIYINGERVAEVSGKLSGRERRNSQRVVIVEPSPRPERPGLRTPPRYATPAIAEPAGLRTRSRYETPVIVEPPGLRTPPGYETPVIIEPTGLRTRPRYETPARNPSHSSSRYIYEPRLAHQSRDYYEPRSDVRVLVGDSHHPRRESSYRQVPNTYQPHQESTSQQSDGISDEESRIRKLEHELRKAKEAARARQQSEIDRANENIAGRPAVPVAPNSPSYRRGSISIRKSADALVDDAQKESDAEIEAQRARLVARMTPQRKRSAEDGKRWY